MHIARFVANDAPHWGFVEGDVLIAAQDAATWEDAITSDAEWLRAKRRAVADSVELVGVRLLAPVVRPSKIIGLARNYRTHGPRDGDPGAPTLFGMVPSALIGPGDSIVVPPQAAMVDWEAELAVVIGRRAKDVPVERALEYVAGYTVLNDVSARDPEIVAGQLFRGKAFDTFKPTGPWLTTVDELADASDLAIRLWVNGNIKQDSRTSELIAGVRELIAFCSSTFTLEPGDVIATGTPGGVGASRQPPEFLAPGDEVVVEIEGIGRLRNGVRAAGDGEGTSTERGAAAKAVMGSAQQGVAR
jgi:2-keto-4-pentenoate hydratase/2-oxohepta-3-ene-1,7-dioic acid hydratase in catechol pathway